MIPLGGSDGIHDKVIVLSVTLTIVSDLGAVGTENTYVHRITKCKALMHVNILNESHYVQTATFKKIMCNHKNNVIVDMQFDMKQCTRVCDV